MDRIEKKRVRLEINNLLDKHCGNCMMRSSYEGHQYCICECPVSKELQTLVSSISNNSVEEFTVEPLPKKSRRWTDEEELYLVNHLKHYNIDHLAIRLDRDPQSVYQKVRRLFLQKKVSAC